MGAGWILPVLVSLAGVPAPDASSPTRPPRVVELTKTPESMGVKVRSRAESWLKLKQIAKPDAVLRHSLFVRCTPNKKEGWTFEASQVYRYRRAGITEWLILERPDTGPSWLFNGSFISGTATCPTKDWDHGSGAQQVGTDANGSTFFHVRWVGEAASAHGNISLLSALLHRSHYGAWKVLWTGNEIEGWNSGSYAVSTLYTFQVRAADKTVPVTISVEERSYYTCGSEQDWRKIGFRRFGRLRGPTPSRISWSGGYSIRAVPGDTCEKIAQKMTAFHSYPESRVAGLTTAIVEANPALAQATCKGGEWVILPPTFKP